MKPLHSTLCRHTHRPVPVSKIPADLIAAYRRTRYRVFTDAMHTMTFAADAVSAELARLLRQHGVAEAAFVTAFNPYGKEVSAPANHRAQQQLRHEVRAAGFTLLEGLGEDASGAWPAEPSILILGIPESRAREIGTAFGQNAYVHVDQAGEARLILLR